LWHDIAVGMFYREQSAANPAIFYHWEQQSLAAKLHYQAKAKKALAEFAP
jgi:hypothetical protein